MFLMIWLALYIVSELKGVIEGRVEVDGDVL